MFAANHHPKLATEVSHNILAISHLAAIHQLGIVAAETCEVAGAIIRESYHSLSRVKGLHAKGLGDFVTETDQKANDSILRILKTTTPEISILSEEGEKNQFRKEQRTWIVDPLDGTSSFIFKTNIGHPAVLIALQHNLQVELGVVYLPLTEEWFLAAPSKGSYYYSQASGGIKLTADSFSDNLQSSWIALNHYGDVSYETEYFNNLRNNLRGPNGAALVTIEVPHSAIGCRILLDNGPAAVVHDNNSASVKQAIWDLAAVKAIVENAGGVILQLDGTTYQLDGEGPIIIARNRELATRLIALGNI